MKRWWMLLILVLMGTAVVGCNTGGDMAEGGEPAAADELVVRDAWGRNAPAAAQNGAFYMVIENNSGVDDTLTGAATDVCGAVELHEMYMKENDVMGMRQVPGGVIDVPDGETVELKVGGLHVMCIGKTQDFALGDEIPIMLTFANAGEMEVTAEIRDMAPDMDMDMEGEGG